MNTLRQLMQDLERRALEEGQSQEQPCFESFSILQINEYFRRRIAQSQRRKKIFCRMFSDQYYAITGGESGIQLVQGQFLIGFKVVIPPLRTFCANVITCTGTPHMTRDEFSSELERLVDEAVERAWNQFERYKTYVNHVAELSEISMELLDWLYIKTRNNYARVSMQFDTSSNTISEAQVFERKKEFEAVVRELRRRRKA